MKFYFMRHPETLANSNHLFYGWKDYPYSEKGEEMFRGAPELTDGLTFDRIYSSDLRRARDLAEAIAQRRGMTVTVDKRLREMNFGDLEGMSYFEGKDKYPDTVRDLFGNVDVLSIPGGESMDDVTARAKDFLDEVKDQEGTVLMVTHAMFLHTMLSYLLGIPRTMMWHFRIDPCMLLRVDYAGGYGVVRSMIPFDEGEEFNVMSLAEK